MKSAFPSRAHCNILSSSLSLLIDYGMSFNSIFIVATAIYHPYTYKYIFNLRFCQQISDKIYTFLYYSYLFFDISSLFSRNICLLFVFSQVKEKNSINQLVWFVVNSSSSQSPLHQPHQQLPHQLKSKPMYCHTGKHYFRQYNLS